MAVLVGGLSVRDGRGAGLLVGSLGVEEGGGGEGIDCLMDARWGLGGMWWFEGDSVEGC